MFEKTQKQQSRGPLKDQQLHEFAHFPSRVWIDRDDKV